jgi:hypothetical protein
MKRETSKEYNKLVTRPGFACVQWLIVWRLPMGELGITIKKKFTAHGQAKH